MGEPQRVPARAWIVTAAGTSVNLCLGILYAWSVWKSTLLATPAHPAGSPMTGHDDGWHYLTNLQATVAYSLCGLMFALFMIPGGRLQDRYGPRLGATLSGLFLGAGCIIAGLMKSYMGLVIGFGLLGGIGMGLGYAAATPAAVRWFGAQRRGLIVGIVVAGYGGAAIYISPLAKYLIAQEGLTGSFVTLGVLFAAVIVFAAQFLKMPPPGYAPPVVAPATPVATTTAASPRQDWAPRDVLRTWQFYALLILMFGSAQSGILVIANAAPIHKELAVGVTSFLANAWLLASFGGFVNASGRIGTGVYSDTVGRANAYAINGLLSVVCLFLLPTITASGNLILLFVVVGVIYWQYGGTLALIPAWTADFFGSKNLGLNYGLVFLGWGFAFFVPLLAGLIKDEFGSLDYAFYFSGTLLLLAVGLSRLVKRPTA